MGRMTVKTSGYAMGTMVAVMFHIDGAPMVGKLAKVNRGYEIQWADGSVRLAWSAGRKVYIRTVGNDFTAEVEAWERNGVEASKVETAVTMDPEDIRQAAREDLYNRALSLGYTDEAAYRLSDCFINWDMVPDACPTHPNHSTAIRGGYAVNSCEACDVIKLSTDAGYTLAGWRKAQAERAAEYARIEAEHAAAYAADLAKFDESDPATWSVVPADHVWPYVTDGGDHPSGAKEQSGMDVLADLLSLDGGKTPAKVIKVESRCRSLNHVYCVGPCPERDRNEANASAARTHVETEAECLARIQREDFRVGDPYTFRNLVGYRLYQDRPFACRGVKCQCGKACHGTTVESVEILIDVAHYVSGGLEIRGDKGSRAVIRVDRLD